MRYFILGLSLLLPATVSAEDVRVEIDNLLRAHEVKYELPSGILHAIAHVESSSNHKVIVKHDGKSGNASYGLMQMQLATARFVQELMARVEGFKITKRNRITPKTLMRPEVNIDYSAYYLKWLLNNHGNNYAWALTCYNAGPVSFLCKKKKYSPYSALILNALLTQSR